jgi:co-chaperonin GroES (HSP10)
MTNQSGVRPTEYKVLVKPDDIEDEIKKNYAGLAAAGFRMADDQKEKEQAAAMSGTIVDASPLAFSYDTWPDESSKPKVGDRVFFSRYAGNSLKGTDGVDYRLINDRDVVAVYGA